MTLHTGDYPYTARTFLDTPDPNTVDPERYGPFIRVTGIGTAIWGFADESGRDLFEVEYAPYVVMR